MYQLLEASLVCIFDISLSSKKSIQQYDEQMVFDQLSWDGSYNPNTQCMLCLPSFGWFFMVDVGKYTRHWVFG